MFEGHPNVVVFETKAGESKAFVHYNKFAGNYDATLLGGEFDNCYGQGNTVEEAIASLKMRIYQLRRKAAQSSE